MSRSEAWLLACDDSLSIAVGDHEMVELLPNDPLRRAAGSVDGIADTVEWQQTRLPVLELGAPPNRAGTDTIPYYCVLNYQPASGMPLRQVAIRVTRAPERIDVDDARVCEIPRGLETARLRRAILSCFVHREQAVLVLDIAALCADDPGVLAAAG